MSTYGYGIIGAEFQEIYSGTQKTYRFIPHKPLLIDFSKKEHYLIIAKSGSGKSYVAGVLAEELIRAMQNYSILIVDPMGIFSTLRIRGETTPIHLWNQTMPLNQIKPEIMKNVEIWIPEGDRDSFESEMYDHTFSLQANQLSAEIFAHVFGLDGVEPQTSLFRKAAAQAKKEYNNEFDLQNLTSIVQRDFEDWHYKSQTVEALNCKLDIMQELNLITKDGIQVSDLIQAKKVSVLDVSMSDTYTAKTIVNFLAERLLKIRKRMNRKVTQAKIDGKLIEKPYDYIPPVMLMIDEAHNFLPGNRILKKYIKEGRNCGCMLTAISQSPDLDRYTYANIVHLFIGQLTYKDDLDGVQKMLPVEKKPGIFRKEIKSLDIGNFYYYNMAEKTERRIRVRPRKTFHPASTEIEDERKYFLKDMKIEQSLLNIIKRKKIMFVHDIPQEMKKECAALIKANKLKIKIVEGGRTCVELA
ncbi:ATP-binding protein [Candidatus Harpocratesius sp.]